MKSIKDFDDISIDILNKKAIESVKAYNAYISGDADDKKLNDVNKSNQSLVNSFLFALGFDLEDNAVGHVCYFIDGEEVK